MVEAQVEGAAAQSGEAGDVMIAHEIVCSTSKRVKEIICLKRRM